MNVLINAALGALLAIAVLDMIPDAKELLPWPKVIAGVISGYALFWVVGKYIYPVCPACSLEHIQDSESLLGRTLILLMIALGIHSTMDGAAVVIGDQIEHGVNLPVFFAISFHKFPEGMALVLLLIGAGYRRLPAFLWTTAIEATTELGALAAILFVRGMSSMWLGLTFANIGGGFLYLVLNTFVGRHVTPEAEAAERSPWGKILAGGVAFALTGALIVFCHGFER